MYGALLGSQKGRSVEICNSFELVVSIVDGHAVLDKEYFVSKEEQCMLSAVIEFQVFGILKIKEFLFLYSGTPLN